MTKKELSVIETAVLSMIPRGTGKKVTLNDICQLTSLSLREVQSVINCLVFKYKIPIVANRGSGGVFIPLTDEQRLEGLKGIKNQVIDLTKRIELVEASDLDNWDKPLKRNYQEALEV
ncbi:hypothetical protein ACQUD9_05210 [Vagococcus fluvialis]|uniref:hypothetical protein n=1 Tax=Vagococcus fluvialis TaxID=2738 RepID=UPI003D149C43